MGAGGAYSIDPAGVQRVLTAVSGDAESLSAAMTPISGHAQSAVTGAASSPVVGDAVSVFFNLRSKNLESVSTRLEAGVSGVIKAVNAYVAGDEEMMLDQQRLAVDAADGVEIRYSPTGSPYTMSMQ